MKSLNQYRNISKQKSQSRSEQKNNEETVVTYRA